MLRIAIGFGLAFLVFGTGLNAEEDGPPRGFGRGEVQSDVRDGCRRETFTLYSSAMKRDIQVRVILPPEYDDSPGRWHPILYALHGKGASFAAFSEMAPLRKALAEKPMIVACFDGGNRSFYLDAINSGRVPKDVVYKNPRRIRRLSGEALEEALDEWEKRPGEQLSLYTTFFFDEFVPAIDRFYRVDTARRAATGFSMGGFGAMHFMLERPAFFVSVSGLSSVFYTEKRLEESEARGRNFFRPLLGSYRESRENYGAILHMDRVEALASEGRKLPTILQHCGTEDRLMAVNESMCTVLQDAGYETELRATPGRHEWPFWKGASAGAIDFHWRHFDTPE